jgi:hypothetical protein
VPEPLVPVVLPVEALLVPEPLEDPLDEPEDAEPDEPDAAPWLLEPLDEELPPRPLRRRSCRWTAGCRSGFRRIVVLVVARASGRSGGREGEDGDRGHHRDGSASEGHGATG